MMKRFLSKTLVLLLAFLMVFSCFGTAVFAADGDEEQENAQTNEKMQEISELLNSEDYAGYREQYLDKPNGTSEAVMLAADYDVEKSTALVYLDKWYGKDAILIGEAGDVVWNFDIAESGNYHITIHYAPVHEYDGDKDGQIKTSADDVENEEAFVAKDFKSNTAAIKRAILIDGSYPFKQSRYIELTRTWKDELFAEGSNDRGFVLDNTKNEVKPNKVEEPEWRQSIACDSTGYVTEPFLYYIEAGSHTLTLGQVQEACAIEKIVISYVPQAPSYEEYLQSHADLPDNSANAGIEVREAEITEFTSSNIIYPLYDRSSAATSPQSAYNIYLNSIGGEKWQTAGQWIRWKIEVSEDGFYTITPRFLQSFAEGMYVSREIRIDGERPYEEAGHLRFKYADEWQLLPLTDGVIDEATGEERALEFYLTAGEHEMEMWVVLGDMAEVLSSVEEGLANVNDYYLQILMLAGSEPDKYRDYQFGRLMPGVLRGMKAESERLYAISEQLVAINGTKGSDSVTLDNVALLLERMALNEDLIAANFSELKDYIGNLGTWIMTARNQPLQIDYFLIAPASAAKEAGHAKYLKENAKDYVAEASFFGAMAYEFEQFLMSWVSDYSSYGVRTAEGAENFKSIEVWTTSGRDQSTIMRNIVSDDFTKVKGIAVDLKLVAAGSLMPATLSGTGPDINMSMGSSTIINYAIRSAIIPINPEGYVIKDTDTEAEKKLKEERQEIFADYHEVVDGNFHAAATVPLELYGIAYGLPETESFSMLFYRSDILLQLGLSIPETWDDVYDMLPTLQTNNLDFGYHESLAGLLIMLYQRGETLYTPTLEADKSAKYDEDGKLTQDGLTMGMSINLDKNESLETFKEMCELYTMYGFPYSYNFANRFRTGEMPIGVQGYTTYSQLTIFAPELRGLWGFTLLPGTPQVDDNGNAIIDPETGKQKVSHIADTNVSGIVMMVGTENIAEAWEFMKWWVSTETQSTYGQEYYALLGASGQYATANKKALSGMSWTADERAELFKQFNELEATPEMPGGYIVARYVEFAFLAAYNDSEDPVESLLDYIDAINSELTRKRNEFELPTLDNYEEFLASQA